MAHLSFRSLKMVHFSRHFTKLRFRVSSSRHFCSQQQQHLKPSLLYQSRYLESERARQERILIESQLVSLLDGCNRLTQLKQVHAHLFRKGLDQCSFLLAKFVRMLTKMGSPIDQYPRLIFDQVHNPNAFLYSAVIRGYCLLGPYVYDSIELYTRMRRDGICPLSFTFSALFKGCLAMGDVVLGEQMHAQTILIGGFTSDLFVGNTMIDMYVKCGCLDSGRRVFDEMLERDVISWTTLIVAYAKNGDMSEAAELFDGLPVKDMVAWTAMITGFAQNGKPKEALKLFQGMCDAGVGTDEVTLVGVISACAQLGTGKCADWIRDVAEKAGLSPSTNVVVGSALIDMYSKCGSVEEAYRVFQCMKQRNVYSYSAMIVGFAMHGKADAAMRLFDEMVKTETKPNRVTFVGVLTACSHAGMVQQGQRIFSSMERDYGVKPEGDHYACMVDILARAGHLKEALELAETTPFETNGGVWGALLGACRIHGNPDIAEIAANHLFMLEPNSVGNYVLLCNIYAMAGRWDNVSRVRVLMRKRGLQKNPACSWTEANDGIVHEFFAGPMTHPRTKEIKAALNELLKTLKSHGYKPNLNSVVYDMSDEEKERLLKTHSEKLALSFALITTSEGSPIRIMKNLRVCEDCHIVMCGASRVMNREIVLRDNLRFHHFRDGVCSCGNFW